MESSRRTSFLACGVTGPIESAWAVAAASDAAIATAARIRLIGKSIMGASLSTAIGIHGRQRKSITQIRAGHGTRKWVPDTRLTTDDDARSPQCLLAILCERSWRS